MKYSNYINEIFDKLNKVNNDLLKKASDAIILRIKKKKNIFVFGNGGSAAVSNHYICDFLKLVRTHTKYKPKIFSLTNSMELITAISNDISYDKIFSYQLESLGNAGDLAIMISASGNSKNILEAIKICKKQKISIISFTGFNGGKLKRLSNIPIHLNLKNYGQAEDSHHILMHFLMEDVIKKLK